MAKTKSTDEGIAPISGDIMYSYMKNCMREYKKMYRSSILPATLESTKKYMREHKPDNSTLAHCDINKWWWGDSHDIILSNGYGSVSMQYIAKEPNTAWICNLHVVGSMRRKDLGNLLLSICIEKAKENNAMLLKLYVDKTKQWLIDWYMRYDFVKTGIEEHEFEMTKIIK
jgi:hypothetical protein